MEFIKIVLNDARKENVITLYERERYDQVSSMIAKDECTNCGMVNIRNYANADLPTSSMCVHVTFTHSPTSQNISQESTRGEAIKWHQPVFPSFLRDTTGWQYIFPPF